MGESSLGGEGIPRNLQIGRRENVEDTGEIPGNLQMEIRRSDKNSEVKPGNLQIGRRRNVEDTGEIPGNLQIGEVSDMSPQETRVLSQGEIDYLLAQQEADKREASSPEALQERAEKEKSRMECDGVRIILTEVNEVMKNRVSSTNTEDIAYARSRLETAKARYEAHREEIEKDPHQNENILFEIEKASRWFLNRK